MENGIEKKQERGVKMIRFGFIRIAISITEVVKE